AIRAIGAPARPLEDFLNVRAGVGRALAIRALCRRLRIDGDLLWIERGQKRVDLVVAKSPEELCRRDDGCAVALRLIRAVETQEPCFSVRIGRGETGVRARRFLTDDRPVLGRWGTAGGWPCHDLVWRQLEGANTICEPAGVRHLVDRVDV